MRVTFCSRTKKFKQAHMVDPKERTRTSNYFLTARQAKRAGIGGAVIDLSCCPQSTPEILQVESEIWLSSRREFYGAD
jgi:hypothetical protein